MSRDANPMPVELHLLIAGAKDTIGRATARRRLADFVVDNADAILNALAENSYEKLATEQVERINAALSDALAREKARADEEAADFASLTREMATICGGPGKPREGETRVAYWLRRVGETLAKGEAELTRLREAIANIRARKGGLSSAPESCPACAQDTIFCECQHDDCGTPARMTCVASTCSLCGWHGEHAWVRAALDNNSPGAGDAAGEGK